METVEKGLFRIKITQDDLPLWYEQTTEGQYYAEEIGCMYGLRDGLTALGEQHNNPKLSHLRPPDGKRLFH